MYKAFNMRQIKFLLAVAAFVTIGGIYTAWKAVRETDLTRQQRLFLHHQVMTNFGKFFPNKTSVTNKTLVTNKASVRNKTSVTNKTNHTQGKYLIDIDQGVPDFDSIFQHLVVVTAFSENHFKEALGMIGSVQKSMPQTRIIVYDLGIKEKSLTQVKRKCSVEVRPFQFKKYPSFVSNLSTYAWKVCIIKDAVNEFGAIFWADASVRFTKSLEVLLPFAYQHHGYLSRIHSYSALTKTPIRHNYYMTVEEMYKVIGVNRKEYSKSAYAPHPASNRQLILNSSTVQEKLLRPLYACAIDKNCISPPRAKHGVNHRFDASALMLVLHKYFPGEYSVDNDHVKDIDSTMYMHRAADDWKTANNCDNVVRHPVQ